MSFDKFLLAVESRDLSQAIIRVSSFQKLFLNDKVYSYTKKNYLVPLWHVLVNFIIQLWERRHSFNTFFSLR